MNDVSPKAKMTVFFARFLQVMSLVMVIKFLAIGILESICFDGDFANGAFQVFNPLRRIADGQVLGKDFHYFHGQSIPYLFYPLYMLFGKTIYASELSRHITATVMMFAALLFFSFVFTKKWNKAFLFFGVIMLLSIITKLDDNLFEPRGSLKNVRMILPIFFIGIQLLSTPMMLKAILSGVFLSLSFLCGTEQGLALGAAFLVTGIVFPFFYRPYDKQCHIYIFFTVLSSGIALLLYMFIKGIDPFISALKFNIVTVGKDQFWYFGVPPNKLFASFEQLSTDSNVRKLTFRICSELIAVIAVLKLFASRTMFPKNGIITIAIMLMYGVASSLSCLGIFTTQYLLPFRLMLVLIASMVIFKAGDRVLYYIYRIISPKIMFFTAIAVIAGLCYSNYIDVPGLREKIFLLKKNKAGTPLRLSQYWSEYTKSIIDSIETNRRDKNEPVSLWSTYSGLIHDHYGIFNPAEDYIIHALGPEKRTAYIDTFKTVQPEFVETIKRSYFPYEEWLQTTTWENAANNYISFEPDANSEIFNIPREWIPKGNTMLLVQIDYSITNPMKKIPFFGKTPRFFVIPEIFDGTYFDHRSEIDDSRFPQPVSLPPYKNNVTFPLVVRSETIRLHFKTFSFFPGVSFTVKKISLRTLHISEKLYDMVR
ncbi:hypothetical protein KDK77_05480 [bacterium]|nr:hypothetical protein [bacterium]